MELNEIKKIPLIVDEDLDFLSSLRRHPDAYRHPPLLATNSRSAMDMISQKKLEVSAIFINPQLESGKTAPVVIQRCLKVDPSIPIIFVCDTAKQHFTAESLQFLSVRQVVYKPLKYNGLLHAVNNLNLNFTTHEAFEVASPTDALDRELDNSDETFSSIIAGNFSSGSMSFFDVYVRIKKDRYIKILQAGDVFSPDRLQHYLDKGLKSFFVRKTAQAAYLKYCELIAKSLLNNAAVSSAVKVTATLNQGEETINFLKNMGVSPDSLHYAHNFISQMTTLFENLDMSGVPEKFKMVSSLAEYDHAVATSVIASLLLKPINYSTERSVHVVGIASMFHDVSLIGTNFSHDTDPTQLSDLERAKYENHPFDSADILKKIPRLDPVIIQSVEQHHERRTRTGFPRKIGFGEICMVGEIIAIADEFARIISSSQKADPIISPLDVMEEKILANFSGTTVDAFRKAFRPSSEG